MSGTGPTSLRVAGPKILMLLPSLGYGGAERLCVALCHAATDAGMAVILAARAGPLTAGLPENPNFKHLDLDLKTKGWRQWRTAGKALNRVIRSEQPDLIHSHSRWPSWLGHRLARRHGMGFITTAHNVHGHGHFAKRLYSGIQQKGRPWIAVSSYVAKKNAALYPAAAAHVKCLPIGADQKRLSTQDALQAERFREKHAIKHTDCLIVVPGRISALYDNARIIDAVSALKNPKVVLLFNGGHKNRKATERLNARAAALNAATRLIVDQNDADFLPALAAADLCLSITARPAAFGMVISEAQSLGCPVFATALGGAVEQIDNPSAAALGSKLIQPANTADLTARLDAFLDAFLDPFDPANRRLRHQARANTEAVTRLRRLFSLETHLQGTLDLYREPLKHSHAKDER